MVFSILYIEKRTMKKYLLLRNNHESGPYSIETIASIDLGPLDLIWVEGESTAWKYPEEIEELKGLAHSHSGSKKCAGQERRNIFVSLPAVDHEVETTSEQQEVVFVMEPEIAFEKNEEKSLPEFKENYRVSNIKKPVWSKKFFQFSNEVNIAAIFIGAVLSAIMIKKMVDGLSPTSLESTATAIPIIDREIEKQPDETIRNAIVTEIVPVYKNIPAKTSKPGNIKKQLKIKTNNYKVGLFGGINGLQLTVFNNSSQFVDKVIVSLDYLRANGIAVQSENISFSSIKPLGSQTITIPGSKRGVKVRYKILKAYTHNYKADLKQA
jgi:hypothetical protein